jgi:hypothetical protein
MSPLKKIETPDKKYTGTQRQPCISREHNPTGHIVLTGGEYEWTCPSCGEVQRFTVPEIRW